MESDKLVADEVVACSKSAGDGGLPGMGGQHTITVRKGDAIPTSTSSSAHRCIPTQCQREEGRSFLSGRSWTDVSP